jgi:hypothetical protein
MTGINKLVLNIYSGLNQTMLLRERNYFFDYAAIAKVQRSLVDLGTTLGALVSLDDFYAALLGCFYSHGSVSKPRPMSSKQEPWMTFLSSEELEVFNLDLLFCTADKLNEKFNSIGHDVTSRHWTFLFL